MLLFFRTLHFLLCCRIAAIFQKCLFSKKPSSKERMRRMCFVRRQHLQWMCFDVLPQKQRNKRRTIMAACGTCEKILELTAGLLNGSHDVWATLQNKSFTHEIVFRFLYAGNIGIFWQIQVVFVLPNWSQYFCSLERMP